MKTGKQLKSANKEISAAAEINTISNESCCKTICSSESASLSNDKVYLNNPMAILLTRI